MTEPARDVGSPAAVISRWHHDHGAALLAFARHRSPGGAEDLVQETFLRAWRSLHQFDAARGSERAWLFAIARNTAADQARRQRRRPLRLVADPADTTGTTGTPVPDRDLEAVGDRALLAVALAELGPAQRQVVVEACVHGRTVADIAARLGVPPGTVKSRLFYGLRAMRAALQETGYEP
jgi:RNA polymerase sigma-70 factor, ECF subfamily